MQAVRSVSIGVLVVCVASACSHSLPRAPATQPVSAANQSGATGSQADVDRAMRQRGYTLASYHGERVYCRSTPVTGSNLESKLCLTARQIADQERAGQDLLNQTRPAGCPPKSGGEFCN
jgi:hypothetical protein